MKPPTQEPDKPRTSAISGQRSAISHQQSAISGQRSAVSYQRSAAVSNQLSAISYRRATDGGLDGEGVCGLYGQAGGPEFTPSTADGRSEALTVSHPGHRLDVIKLPLTKVRVAFTGSEGDGHLERDTSRLGAARVYHH